MSRPLAVVAGASSGIGYELAKQFAQHGYDLVVCAAQARIEGAAEELRQFGGRVVPLQADLATRQGCEALARSVARRARRRRAGDAAGSTDTEFFTRAHLDDTKVAEKSKDNHPADVARMGFEGLMAGKERVVAGNFSVKMQGVLARFMPEGTKAGMHKKMSEHGSAKS